MATLPRQCLLPSTQILNTFHAKKIKVVAVGGGSEESATDGFSLVVTSSGGLYSFGTNSRGQLGVGDLEDRLAMVPVNLPTKSIVQKVRSPPRMPPVPIITHSFPVQLQVSAGMAFALAITQDGRVYAWGANDAGQLGLGDTRDRSQPVLIPGNLARHEVVQVACGAEHTVALTATGLLFTWGEPPPPPLRLLYPSPHKPPALATSPSGPADPSLKAPLHSRLFPLRACCCPG